MKGRGRFNLAQELPRCRLEKAGTGARISFVETGGNDDEADCKSTSELGDGDWSFRYF